MKNRMKIVSLSLFILYFALVVFLCLFDFSGGKITLPSTFMGIPTDKIVHAIMFMPFPILVWLNFSYFKPSTSIRILIVLILVGGILFACLTELSQHVLTSYRSLDFTDFIADVVGLSIGTLIFLFFGKSIKQLLEKLTAFVCCNKR